MALNKCHEGASYAREHMTYVLVVCPCPPGWPLKEFTPGLTNTLERAGGGLKVQNLCDLSHRERWNCWGEKSMERSRENPKQRLAPKEGWQGRKLAREEPGEPDMRQTEFTPPGRPRGELGALPPWALGRVPATITLDAAPPQSSHKGVQGSCHVEASAYWRWRLRR